MKSYDLNEIEEAIKLNSARTVPPVTRIVDDAPRPVRWYTREEPRGTVSRPSKERVNEIVIERHLIELVDYSNAGGDHVCFGIKEGTAYRKIHLDTETGDLHVGLDLIF
jgi:hypothetical protein